MSDDLDDINAARCLGGCTLVTVRATLQDDKMKLQLVDGGTLWTTPGELEAVAEQIKYEKSKWGKQLSAHLNAILLDVQSRLQAPECVTIQRKREQQRVRDELESRASRLHDAVQDAALCDIDEDEVVRIVGDVRDTWRQQIQSEVMEK